MAGLSLRALVAIYVAWNLALVAGAIILACLAGPCRVFGHRQFDNRGNESAHENLYRCWRCGALRPREVA